jgi:protein TonB
LERDAGIADDGDCKVKVASVLTEPMGGGVAPQLPASGPRTPLNVLHAAIGASIVVHAIVLSIHFKLPEALVFQAPPQLEVVLVNAKTKEKPKNADVLAQANLDRGGNTDEKRVAKTAAPVLPQVEQGDDVKRAQRRVQELEQKQKELLAATKPQQAAIAERVPDPKPVETPPQPQPQLSGVDMAASALAIARMEAQIARQTEQYNKRPRRAFVGARAQEVRYAQYVEDWRQKIERIGNLNYPAEARGRIYGSLQLTVEVNSDGSLRSVHIDRPSGQKVLDRAAERIVHLAAPYAVFPPDVRKDTDILVITRTWTFTPGDKLRSD